MADLGSAIASISTAFNILKGAVAARDDALITSAQNEMQQRLNDALGMTLSQLQTIHSLELEAQKLRTELEQANSREQRLKSEIEQRRAYKLEQPAPGKWAYVRVEDHAGPPDATAYFCASCKAEHREVPLQYKAATQHYGPLLVCPLERRHTMEIGPALPQSRSPKQNDAFARRW